MATLSQFALVRPVTVNLANVGAGGKVVVNLTNKDIAPQQAQGYDIVPFAPDNATQLVFTRVYYTASNATAQLIVTLPASIPITGSYIILVASGLASATDQSVALVKSGPLSGNTALSWWQMTSSGAAATDSLSQNLGTGSAAANPLTLVGSPVTTNPSLSVVPGTSVACPGVCISLNGTSQYFYTTNTVTNKYLYPTAGSAVGFTLHWRMSNTNYANGNYQFPFSMTSNIQPYCYISPAGHVVVQLVNGLLTPSTVLSNGTHDCLLVSNAVALSLYIDGVVFATAVPISPSWASIAQKIYFGVDVRSGAGSPANYFAGSMDNVWCDAQSYTAADAMASYLCSGAPIAQQPLRKLSRINLGGSYTGSQIWLAPIVGFGSYTGSKGGMQEPCWRYAPNYGLASWPNVAGVTGPVYWLATATDSGGASDLYTVGWAYSQNPDPTVGSAWVINPVPIVGQGYGGQSGTAGMNDWWYDSVQGLYFIFYSDSYSGGNIWAISNANWSSTGWSAPVKVIVSGSVSGYNGFFNSRTTPISTGGYLRGVDATPSSGGGFREIFFTSPNLTNGGTWTYSSAITAAFAAGIAAANNFTGDLGTCQQNGVTYAICEVGGQNCFAVATTDTTNFTTWTGISAPINEPTATNEALYGFGDPRLEPYTNNTASPFSSGGNGVYSYIFLAIYSGSPAQLFAAGTTLAASGGGGGTGSL